MKGGLGWVMNFAALPLIFLKFWYFEAPRGIWGFFASVKAAFFQLFSLPLFARTFFKPIKNEYREGLVGFSIFMGMMVKSFIIVADLIIFAVLLAAECLVIFSFLAFPIATIWLLLV